MTKWSESFEEQFKTVGKVKKETMAMIRDANKKIKKGVKKEVMLE